MCDNRNRTTGWICYFRSDSNQNFNKKKMVMVLWNLRYVEAAAPNRIGLRKSGKTASCSIQADV